MLVSDIKSNRGHITENQCAVGFLRRLNNKLMKLIDSVIPKQTLSDIYMIV